MKWNKSKRTSIYNSLRRNGAKMTAFEILEDIETNHDKSILLSTIFNNLRRLENDGLGSVITARQNGPDMESIKILGLWQTDTMPKKYTKQTNIKKNTAAFKFGF